MFDQPTRLSLAGPHGATRTLAVIALGAAACAGSASLRREDPDPAGGARPVSPGDTTGRRARADLLFKQARRLAKQQQHAEACALFADSDRIERTFGTALNLGDCALRDGHRARAWQLYDAAARVAERAGTERLARFAHDQAAALEPQLATITLTLAAPDVPGLAVQIGGRNVAPAPEIRMLVDPGPVDIIVTVAGKPVQRNTVRAVAGSATAIAYPERDTRSGSVPAVRGANAIPGFVLIDRLDASSRAGLEVTSIEPRSAAYLHQPTQLRFEAHAHYVESTTGLGGYLHAPLAYDSSGHSAMEKQATQLGDIEIGGLFAPKPLDPRTGLVFHLGIALPTTRVATDTMHRQPSEIPNLVALSALYNSQRSGTTAKLGGSVILRSASLYTRLDLGIDLNFLQPFDASDATLHYNLGLGLEARPVIATLEFENAVAATRFGESRGINTFNAFGASARVNTRFGISPYLATVIPLQGILSQLVDFAVTLGLDIAIP